MLNIYYAGCPPAYASVGGRFLITPRQPCLFLELVLVLSLLANRLYLLKNEIETAEGRPLGSGGHGSWREKTERAR
jgi:hypothetical protein